MKPRKFLSPEKLSWLAELGVDTHWLSVDTAPAKIQPVKKPQLKVTPPQNQTKAQTSQKIAVTDGFKIGKHQGLDSLYAEIKQQHQANKIQTPLVLGFGVKQNPKYLIIGGQPGLGDEIYGKPFQGEQNLLLNAIFAEVKLPAAQSCFKTCVYKYRGANTDAMYEHFLAILKQEINFLAPANIIALGKDAAKALLGKNLADVRGKTHVYTDKTGRQIPLWLSHHPAALLVHASRKEQAWRDFLAISHFNAVP